MPKVPVYNRQVSDSNLPNVTVQAPGDANAYGAANAQALGNMGKAVDQFDTVLKQRELELKQQRDAMKVMDISSKFDADNLEFFHKKETGLFDQKLDKAEGTYAKTAKYFADKLKEYDSMAENDTQRAAFRQYLSGRQRVYSYNASVYEIEQFHASKEAKINGVIADSIRGAEANYNNFNALNAHMATGIQAITAGNIGAPKEALDAKIADFKSKSALAALDVAINNNNWDVAKKISDTYGGLMDAGDKSRREAVIRDKTEKIQVYQTAKQAVANAKTYEEALANAMAAAKPHVDFETWFGNVVQDESGGSYDVVSPAGAIGKYQIMPATWKTWAPKVGLSEDAPTTKENQEKVGRAILKYYYDTYGPYAGAVAFYSGEQNGQRVLEGKTTLLNDEGQEYGLYDKQGEFPSVDEYAQRKLRGGQLSPEMQMKIEAQVAAEWEDKRKIKAYAHEDAMKNLKNQLAASSGLLADKFVIIDNAPGLEFFEKETLKSQLKNRMESDIDTRAYLNRKYRDGTLSAGDVEQVRSGLTGDHYLDYLEKADKVTGNRTNKETAAADKKWAADLRISGPYAGKAAETNKLEVEVEEELNRRGIQGADRYSAALEIIDREKKEKGSVINYSINNNSVRQGLVSSYGERSVSLMEAGFKDVGGWNKDYRRMQDFTAIIDGEIKSGDPYAKAAWSALVDQGIRINDTTYENMKADIQKLHPEWADQQRPAADSESSGNGLSVSTSTSGGIPDYVVDNMRSNWGRNTGIGGQDMQIPIEERYAYAAQLGISPEQYEQARAQGLIGDPPPLWKRLRYWVSKDNPAYNPYK